jgi:hypothetical protein
MADKEWVHQHKKDIMLPSWALCGVGTLFCGAGVYTFYRNVYERNKKMLAGSATTLFYLSPHHYQHS